MVETETKIQRYDSYKDSGVEWLGDIPEHWEIRRLKSFLEVFGRIGFRGYTTNDLVDEGSGAITISPSNFGDSNLEWTKNSYLSWDKYYESPEIMVEVGDLLIVKTASIGKIAHVKELPEKATVNPQILVVKNVKEDNRFIFYQFLSIVFQTQLMKEKIGSTIYTISENKILNGFALLPPLPEQTAIAQFLDDKTTKIDQAIAIKQQQIALLKERKQILIHKAVTRGLDDSVPLKDSGVEWIGEIPAHWEVKSLRYISESFPSNIDKHSKPLEKKVRLCNYTDVYKNDYITDDMKLMIATATDEQIRKFTLYKGDIVITKDSETASDIAVPTYIFENLTNVVCGYHLAVIRPNKNIYGQYLFRALQCKAFNIQFELEANGITRVGLGISDLRKAKFLVSPISEQKEISAYIETASQKIEAAIGLKQQEIEKLKEYKGSLVNSCVTGKVKVF